VTPWTRHWTCRHLWQASTIRWIRDNATTTVQATARGGWPGAAPDTGSHALLLTHLMVGATTQTRLLHSWCETPRRHQQGQKQRRCVCTQPPPLVLACRQPLTDPRAYVHRRSESGGRKCADKAMGSHSTVSPAAVVHALGCRLLPTGQHDKAHDNHHRFASEHCRNQPGQQKRHTCASNAC